MFYFDKNIKFYEENFLWDNSLSYLENKYAEVNDEAILNSLIGFSWYYLIEGPIESKKFQEDECRLGLFCWKNYIDIGLNKYSESPFYNFIAGYTLCLNGFLIDKEFSVNYEKLGTVLMEKCAEISCDNKIGLLATNFIKMARTNKYKPFKCNKDILEHLFCHDSLIEKYFIEIYSKK